MTPRALRRSARLSPTGPALVPHNSDGEWSERLEWLPWGLFVFLYLPLIYWSGLTLKPTQVIDFPGIYLGPRLAFVHHATPYGYAAFDDFALAWDRWIAPFVYPPPSLIALWPLSLFSIDTAFILFTIVSHLCLLGTVWLILRKLIPLPERKAVRTLVVSVCLTYIVLSDSVAATLNLGQINIITTFFICLSVTALIENQAAWRVAWPLSIAILLKTYPVLLILLLLVRRRFRAAALTSAFCAVFVVVALWVLPGEIWTSWLTEVLPAAGSASATAKLFSHSKVSFVWDQSITGFLTRLMGHAYSPLFRPKLVAPLARIVTLVMTGVTAWVSLRAGRTPDDTAAFLLLMYLIAPVSWDHHLVFILPAAALTIVLILNGSVKGKWLPVMLLLALCLIAWRMNLERPILEKGWWSLLASLKFFSVLGLWLFFVRRLHGSRNGGSGALVGPSRSCPV